MARDAAPPQPTPPVPPGSGNAEAVLCEALTTIESNLRVLLGHLPGVREACATVEAILASREDLAAGAHARLAAAAARRRSACAREVCALLARRAAAAPDPLPVVLALLRAAAEPNAVEAALGVVERRRIVLDAELVGHLATALAETGDDEEVVERLARGAEDPAGDARTALEELLAPGLPGPTRRLAARILDRAGSAPCPELARGLLGETAHAALAPLLAFTRAGHTDLVALTPGPDRIVPSLTALVRAASTHGLEALGRLIAELSWPAVSRGLRLRRLVGLSLGQALPLVVTPAEGRLLEACGPSRRCFEYDVAVAHGGVGDEEGAEAGLDTIRRFRGYNVAHAELLGEILAVEPVTAAKARRILGLTDRIVADFAVLFGEHDEEAPRVSVVYAPLRERVEKACQEADADEQPLPLAVTREIQTFEDPRALYEVRTVHGLKRYLHQRGLRNAFRLFRTGATANRSVDLAVASPGGSVEVVRPIRYIDFEPASSDGEIPWVVELLIGAFVHQLVHGVTSVPTVEVLVFGTEVQVYVRFRNHPAFLRLDLSPPLRGGMLDLEYFAVSQYELEQHPDLELPAIQEVLRRLGCAVERDGLRLHARYDKEQATSLDELLEVVGAVFRLLPSLMDLDWTIGGLDYPAAARERIARAWAERFCAWGVLPLAELLTADRCGVVAGRERGAGGEREVRWDGDGTYRDRYSAGVPPEMLETLRRVIDERDLAVDMQAAVGSTPLGQRWLERTVLEPLRDAVATGELVEEDGELTPATGLAAEHEAVHLARVLAGGGAALARVVGLADRLRALERHLLLRPTGTVNGFPVERANFTVEGAPATVVVLRDGQGVIRLLEVVRGRRLLAPHDAADARPANLLELTDLMRRLRRANFLPPGAGVDEPNGVDGPMAVAAVFAAPNPRAAGRPEPGDRVARGVPACGGRAAGPARFDLRRSPAALLDGSVLVAQALGPADAPLLRGAAALVSTGGGVLSHLGTVALELGKPSLVVAGRWERPTEGLPVLLLPRMDYREEEISVGRLHVSCWNRVREHEEAVREGDLLVVDADMGLLWLLGGDREAIGLARELRQLRTAVRELGDESDEAEALERRGRLLRAAHALGRLAGQTRRQELVRYLAWELLLDLAAGDHGVTEHRRVLAVLLGNPVCGRAAATAIQRLVGHLAGRFDALAREAESEIPRLGSPQEIAFVRLAVVRLAAALSALSALDLTVPPMAEVNRVTARVEAATRARLEELTVELLQPAPDAESGRWRRRHVYATAALAQRLLAGATAPSAWPARRHRARRPAVGRLLVRPADGGAELAGETGAKAANLGELARILGPCQVPPWFALTDHAFRLALAVAVPGGGDAAAPGGPAAVTTLGDAIAAVMDRTGDEPERQASAIRALWRGASLPPSLEAALQSAYRSLGDAGTPAMVAVRSSGREEDAEASAWAGQFDTFLYVSGEESLVEHVKLAWAGLWSERAISHRASVGTGSAAVGGGVIVQRMVGARVAGVLHTVSAATGQVRELVINVGLGLGEGVVSGAVEVDQVFVSKDSDPTREALRLRYLVGDKRTRMAFDERRGRGTCLRETLFHQRMRPALEYGELCELVQVAARLEAVFRQPLDIEFAWEGSDLYILQVRPVALFRRAVEETLARFPLAPPPLRREEVTP